MKALTIMILVIKTVLNVKQVKPFKNDNFHWTPLLILVKKIGLN